MRTLFVTFKPLIVLILLGIGLLSSFSAFAKKTPAAKANDKSLPSTKLSTDIRFDSLTVHGRHQSPFGVTSVVEAEKETLSLVDYRKDFSDRMDILRQGR